MSVRDNLSEVYDAVQLALEHSQITPEMIWEEVDLAIANMEDA